MAVFSSPSEPDPIQAVSLNEDERARLVDFLQRLVQTPSPSSHEGQVAQLVVKELQSAGVEDIHVDRAGNVIARMGSGSGPTLLYDAHLDTVAVTNAEWPYNPYEAVIEDEILYGLGACDMKGSVAAMVYAAQLLIKSKSELKGNLVFAFVVQEEPCEGGALKVLLNEENIRPDWVILGEPSDMNIMRGHRGRVLFKVTVHGESSHSSNPELGKNAITAAARLIFGIDLLSGDLPRDPFLGIGTVAVTHIESQSASLNAIPDICTFYVDRRLTLGETPTRAQAQLEGIVEREGIDAEIEIVKYNSKTYTGYELSAREAFNAWALEENHELIQRLSKVSRQVLGHVPVVRHWPFSTDGVYSMGEANIPTIGIGPGNPEHAHTIHDQVRLADVEQAAQIYALMAMTMLKST
jgi:putative selenium metabolism hydrolase